MQIAKNYAHVFWRVPAILIWISIMPTLFLLCKALRVPNINRLPHVFHRGVRAILGFRLSVSGDRSRHKPTLYVSNHISYLDVFALGDIPAFFIAKSEVAGWPVLGRLAKFQNTLFIERKPGRTKHSLTVMQEHINTGNSLTLFAEGTSTDGVHVEPFKSSLFEAANVAHEEQRSARKRVAIQPITIAYTHQANRKMNRAMLDYYAWYADMAFLPHFLALFALKKVDVKVHFHPVCYLSDFETRKHCADHCQSIVSKRLDEFMQ